MWDILYLWRIYIDLDSAFYIDLFLIFVADFSEMFTGKYRLWDLRTNMEI